LKGEADRKAVISRQCTHQSTYPLQWQRRILKDRDDKER